MSKLSKEKIPLFIIHGNLGSGKTSFIQKIVKDNYFKNAYIIENEFANCNIDKGTLGEHLDEDKIIDISGGCVCCSSGEELIDSLINIAKINKSKSPVLLETTGIADSVQLLKKLFLEPEFSSNYFIKKNILIIDLLESNIKNLDDIVLDISLSDLIVFSKADLAISVNIEEYTKKIQSINPESHIIVNSREDIVVESLVETSSNTESYFLENFAEIANHIGQLHSDKARYEIIEMKKQANIEMLKRNIINIFKNGGIFRVKGNFINDENIGMHIEATPKNIEITKSETDSIENLIVIIGSEISFNRHDFLQ